MLENALIAEIITRIEAGLTAAGSPYSAMVVVQAQQPTQEGTPLAPTIFLTKLPNYRYGHVGRSDKWDDSDPDPANWKMVHTETQWIESTFQVNALAIQDPANVTQITPMDILERVAAILQSDVTITKLLESEIGIYRITAIRQPFFVDDRGRNEASPSFDFILSHKQVIITETPVVVTEEFNFNRV